MIDLATAEKAAVDDVVAVRTRRDLVIATGPDAGEYLHGQLSQNVTGLSVGETARTLLLQPQGKVDAWGRLYRRTGTEFWLDVDEGHGAAALARLERFKLRVDADIRLVTVDVVAIRGPGATALSAEVTGEPDAVRLGVGWPGVEGFDLVAADLGPIDAPASIAEGPSELLEVLRARFGIPAMGSELDDGTIPAAAGVVDLSVDFTKGCYVGQELVARVDSRGNNTPTRLHRLSFDDEGPDGADWPDIEPGAELIVGDVVVGAVTTVVSSASSGPVGLGYLKRSVETPATVEVRSAQGARPVRAEPVPGLDPS